MEACHPQMPAERVERLRRWHEEASAELHRLGAHDVEYFGLDLHVPEQVFPPTPTSDLLGREARRRVQPGDRAPDMGCGAGANAILAAQIGRFIDEVPSRLRPGGQVLLIFGGSGDVAHLDHLIGEAELAFDVAAGRTIHVRGEDANYFVRCLTGADC